MKIVTVLGARPQFIKAAPVSRELRRVHEELIVHTGQHYDALMSDIFFDELGIPAPDATLHVGSASHGAQTARMLEGVEAVLLRERPDAVLVYGDTNSTLAGALAASKLGIAIVHVEAGLRSFVRHMPEEINRVLTDRLSDVCCCPSDVARANLAAEGLTKGVHVVGDVMLDALTETAARLQNEPLRVQALGVEPGSFVLATVHRAANTDDPARLRSIVDALGAVGGPVLWPIHPRARHAIRQQGVLLPANVRVVEPLGYFDLVSALTHARAAVTDSGGLQKEAYWLGIPCVTLRDETEWTETVASGWNVLVDADTERIVEALRIARRIDAPRTAYGTVGAAARVALAIEHELT